MSKAIIFLILILNNINTFPITPIGTVAFETDQQAIEAGWVIDINNQFNRLNEIVIVKLWLPEGYKWFYGKTERRGYDNFWYIKICENQVSFPIKSNNIGKLNIGN